jgi:dTDP-glucose 4,6-dehydratase
MRVLITGAAGFAGSHIVEELTSNWSPFIKDIEIVALDNLTYAGRLDRLAHIGYKSIQFVHHDFRFPLTTGVLKQIGSVDYIIHNGAESHVPKSFREPRIFVESNIVGTLNMLQAARLLQPKKFIYISTDEVFGPARDNDALENDPLRPTNPYAATKAGGELLAYSYFCSFKVPVIITRTMNMFGERQHPEKFVPMTIGKMLRGEKIQVHATVQSILPDVWIAGRRNWLHACVQASAIKFLLEHGQCGECYHISGVERSNLEIVFAIADALGVYPNWEYVESPNPVHDFSYALDSKKIHSLGWSAPEHFGFEESLRKTVLWTAEHQEFLKP